MELLQNNRMHMIIIAEASDDIPGQPQIPDGDQMTGIVDAPPPYEAPPPYPGQQGTHAVQFVCDGILNVRNYYSTWMGAVVVVVAVGVIVVAIFTMG